MLVAAMIVVMIFIGGATRLTNSGLSITEWKPIRGTFAPANEQQWQAEFENYKKIPQYKAVNAHMTLDDFKGIYWWEWWHRLFGRLIGAVFFLPWLLFLLRSEMPKRIIWRSVAILGLGGLQGGLGWWMVSSGLSQRIDVAPERLMIHLGVALILLIMTLWTAFEASEGQGRGRYVPFSWRLSMAVWLGLMVLQCLLGALVAGNDAGLVYNDFPLMNGYFAPYVDWAKGLWSVFFHDQGMVQFMHRINAYLLLVYGIAFTVTFNHHCRDDSLNFWVNALCVGLLLQAVLGIATLLTVVQIHVALSHQVLAALLVALGTYVTWRIYRADRVFR